MGIVDSWKRVYCISLSISVLKYSIVIKVSHFAAECLGSNPNSAMTSGKPFNFVVPNFFICKSLLHSLVMKIK